VGTGTDDAGLRGLAEVLEDAGIDYWVDSGVLLGLVRSGRLLRWEKDVDLAITAVDAQRLLELEGRFASIGYRTGVHRYRGHIYALSLQPTVSAPDGTLRAGIHVFRRTGDHLWSPQTQMYVPPPAPDILRGPPSAVGRAARWAMERWMYSSQGAEGDQTSRAPDRETPVTKASRFVYRRVDQGALAETWPTREVCVPLTWVLPHDLVFPLATLEAWGRPLPVPGRTEDYLAYRYGDWRSPTSQWCYWEDDGAIRRAPPVDVVPRLRHGALNADEQP
jgi:hypothetical protein